MTEKSCKKCIHYNVCYAFRGDRELNQAIEDFVNVLMTKTDLDRNTVTDLIITTVALVFATTCRYYTERE